MSQFSDIVAQVYSMTDRPDLVADTALAVRQGTLAAHRCEKFPRDIVELLVAFTSSQNPILSIPDVFPRWRQFTYLRPYDTSTGSAASYLLDEIGPTAIFDEYMIEKTNVWYLGGTNLNIKPAAAINGLLVGYYSNPIVQPDDAYNSWIAENYSAIQMYAAKAIFEQIGYLEAANSLSKLLYGAQPGSDIHNITGGEFMLLKSSELEGTGR